MQLALSPLPDLSDGTEFLTDGEGVLSLVLVLLGLALCIGMVVVLHVLVRPWLEQQASPVEKIVRKRRAF